MPPAKANKNQTSTQNTLLIAEIRDGVVVMRDGSMRAVVMGSSVNFDLMSTQEQTGVEYAYQGFLNSLHFLVQIVIASRKIDIDGYIEKLQALRQNQSNELLANLMDDYIANIQSLVEEVNIMDKKFYVVVPYFPTVKADIKQTKHILGKVQEAFKPKTTVSINETDFREYKKELTQRVALVSNGLTQMGIRAVPLNTQELIDLYYSWYNPDVAQNEKLIEAAQMQTPVVTKGEGSAPKPPLQGGPL
jgi:hypothetical protein